MPSVVFGKARGGPPKFVSRSIIFQPKLSAILDTGRWGQLAIIYTNPTLLRLCASQDEGGVEPLFRSARRGEMAKN